MRPAWVFASLLAATACSSAPAEAPPDDGIEVADAAVPADADPPTLRRLCAFGPGASVASTLGQVRTAAGTIPVDHVVVVMKENRSFDEILGRLHDRGQPAIEPIPSWFVNRDDRGAAVAPFHETSTCVPHDPAHQWGAAHAQCDNGKMDGFVRTAAASTHTDGHFVMGGYDETDLPFYYFLARTYAVDDRHFSSARTGTYPNRLFLLLGTPDGVTATGTGYPDGRTRTLLEALTAAHVSWGAYSDGSILGGALGWHRSHAGVGSYAAFLAALDAGTLPSVSFVDGVDDVTDEHPPADVQRGEAWTREIYEHAVASPLWSRLAIFWTYDEAGGFADHVPPPPACEPRDVPQDERFVELGVRVPFVVISPWAKPHHVSHVVQDHAAIARFVELLFDLPALTARDANSGALLELFDFQSPPALLVPPPAPPAGTGGCSR